MKSVILRNEKETLEFAQKYATELKQGDVVVLEGDLGAGKTTFAKGVAKGLGITELVTSPTFAIHNVYESGSTVLNHFDFYRLDASEAEVMGLNEFFGQDICLVEWAENVRELLPEHYRRVKLTTLGATERRVELYEDSCD